MIYKSAAKLASIISLALPMVGCGSNLQFQNNTSELNDALESQTYEEIRDFAVEVHQKLKVERGSDDESEIVTWYMIKNFITVKPGYRFSGAAVEEWLNPQNDPLGKFSNLQFMTPKANNNVRKRSYDGAVIGFSSTSDSKQYNFSTRQKLDELVSNFGGLKLISSKPFSNDPYPSRSDYKDIGFSAYDLSMFYYENSKGGYSNYYKRLADEAIKVRIQFTITHLKGATDEGFSRN